MDIDTLTSKQLLKLAKEKEWEEKCPFVKGQTVYECKKGDYLTEGPNLVINEYEFVRVYRRAIDTIIVLDNGIEKHIDTYSVYASKEALFKKFHNHFQKNRTMAEEHRKWVTVSCEEERQKLDDWEVREEKTWVHKKFVYEELLKDLERKTK